VFSGLPQDSKGRGHWLRRYRTVGLSVAVHLAVLAAIAFHNPSVVRLNPTWLAWGNADHSYRVTYIPPGDNEQPPTEAKLTLPAAAIKPKPAPHAQTQKPKPPKERRQPEPNADEGSQNSKAGSPLGTVLEGPITGHEVHVAYPVVYPDPPVNRAELPHDLVGDVVIEVTIDAQGNVVDTKIVQAIGHGIDEKIEATLRRWHYQPATLDGSPVASRHDVHFHFPS